MLIYFAIAVLLVAAGISARAAFRVHPGTDVDNSMGIVMACSGFAVICILLAIFFTWMVSL